MVSLAKLKKISICLFLSRWMLQIDDVLRTRSGCARVSSKIQLDTEDSDYDSVSPSTEGVYSDFDELFVFNPRAILPCFVVIYSANN
jgi:hypothetical protein